SHQPMSRRAASLSLSLSLSLALALRAASAQDSAPRDSVAERFVHLARAARAHLAADAGRTWGARLDTIPWMGVAGKHIHLTDDPRRQGYEAGTSGAWSGALPGELTPANTSVEWGGRRWAMVLLPLPADSAAAVRLLIHEATHVAQPEIVPRPAANEMAVGSALLDEPEGRSWLQLEWRALAAALDARGAARERALGDALLFRARRYAVAAPAERERERALDLSEGLPEYTAWRLTGGDARALARSLRADAPSLPTFGRAFPYFTGPAYALLLDARASDAWRARLRAMPDLQLLALGALRGTPPEVGAALRASGAISSRDSAALARRAETAGRRYGLDSLRAAEGARWAERQRLLAELRARFVTGPTIRLRPRSLQISFDPRGQISLAGDGTVMGNLVWRGANGAELRAPAGALVAPDWSEIRVPVGAAALAPGALAEARRWEGEGWTLALPAGWVVAAEGASWVVTPPPAASAPR
ncbi:MAG TPA: hypothetical protein VFS05_16155, partial [Gemmatimonadaceae bacterium]|nr:hypothetical protein [Gemmatimonadaceae bacterium]